MDSESRISSLRALRLASIAVLGLLAPVASAGTLEDVWYPRLVAELGSALPDGTGVKVSQIEVKDSSGHYTPATTHSEFQGKTFIPKSGVTSGSSGHATGVGRTIYGNTESVGRGVTSIMAWDADSWSGSGFLKTASNSAPAFESADIQNHSWIGEYEQAVHNQEGIRRFDFAIERDNFVAVVGMGNRSSEPLPALLAHSYNAIAVGRSSGGHSTGFTTFDGSGRTKPDLVAPGETVSGATGMTSGVAAMLWEAASGTQGQNSEVIKAALLAGATKHAFDDWSQTTTRPLDPTFGAGQLNAYRSHQIIAAGEQAGGSSTEVGLVGWDFSNNSVLDEHHYFFSVDQPAPLHELSVALTWNRIVTDGRVGSAWGNPQSSLANLQLELFEASDFQLGSSLALSDSPVDNVEHLYVEQLPPGQYAIRVAGASNTDFALAWSGTDYSLLGDVNLDGIVAGDGSGAWHEDDVTAFVEGWGWQQASGDLDSWRKGDLNQDGVTNLADFVLLRDQLAAAQVPQLQIASLLAGGTAAVPEPSSIALASAVAGWLLWRVYRRRPVA